MTASSATALFHVLGFLTASALYVMLAAMTLRSRGRGPHGEVPAGNRSDLIPLATAFLGLVWNVGELIMFGLHATEAPAPSWLVVIAFASLFYLPAVVVDSALAGAGGARSSARRATAPRVLVAAAYALATTGTILDVIATLRGEVVPTPTSSAVLGFGFAAIVAVLVVYSRRQPAWRRALPAAGVAAFAVMLAHFTQHSSLSDHWLTELVGHHGSLLVVLVILYQDYRFAFADLFLKRAVTLLALTGLAAALYAGLVVPLVLPRLESVDGRPADPLAAAALLALWVGTALTYPRLRRVVSRFVDRTVLRRPEAGRVLADVTTTTATLTTVDAVLDAVCSALARGLSATRITWVPDAASSLRDTPSAMALPVVTVLPGGRESVVRVATGDPPAYRILIGGLSGGRRFLSDDYALLDGAARVAARRIDALRVAHERCERDVREQQIMRLATEAELRALRAQLNPHFLFNALTTIGCLIREAPDRALETLWRLTDVLRAVLKRSDGEFTTLGEELEIVSAYLAIERARFEDRLRVATDVAPELGALRIPPLVLQPVVENAVKHGIGSLVRGGCIMISAHLEETGESTTDRGPGSAARRQLCLTVTDTGLGTAPSELARRRKAGTGLANIERRLERYYGASASLDIRSAIGVGTTVDIRLPASLREYSRLSA